MVIEGKKVSHIILRCEIYNDNGNVIAEGIGARSVEQDKGALNKALKMAKKSALIDATLQAGGLSEIFTQDLEDMPPHGDNGNASPPKPPTPAPKPPNPASASQTQTIERMIQSSVFTDKEKASIAGRLQRGMAFPEASNAIQWLQTELSDRKAAIKDDARI